ncbi:hypothetical protein Hanom_Chr10g00923241 [Helianthus anomalus]
MDYHVLNSTKRKKSLFINFLPNTQNRFFAISKHNNQIIRLKTQSQTPSKSPFLIIEVSVLYWFVYGFRINILILTIRDE